MPRNPRTIFIKAVAKAMVCTRIRSGIYSDGANIGKELQIIRVESEVVQSAANIERLQALACAGIPDL